VFVLLVGFRGVWFRRAETSDTLTHLLPAFYPTSLVPSELENFVALSIARFGKSIASVTFCSVRKAICLVRKGSKSANQLISRIVKSKVSAGCDPGEQGVLLSVLTRRHVGDW